MHNGYHKHVYHLGDRSIIMLDEVNFEFILSIITCAISNANDLHILHNSIHPRLIYHNKPAVEL